MRTKLSQLTREESDQVIRDRIANTEWLRREAMRSRDFLVRDAADLDALAKSHGCFVEYNEDLDPEEDGPF